MLNNLKKKKENKYRDTASSRETACFSNSQYTAARKEGKLRSLLTGSIDDAIFKPSIPGTLTHEHRVLKINFKSAEFVIAVFCRQFNVGHHRNIPHHNTIRRWNEVFTNRVCDEEESI